MAGRSPHPYIPAFNVSFLSTNEDDIKAAISESHPAGVILPSKVVDADSDTELRIAFDFDGVIVNDEAEIIFKKGGLEQFQVHETEKCMVPLQAGPLGNLIKKLSELQKLEEKYSQQNPEHKKILRIAIITARNAPAHTRMITTFKEGGISADEVFFLGGIKKANILTILKPHIFFDDQLGHLQSPENNLPMVPIPFGISNENIE